MNHFDDVIALSINKRQVSKKMNSERVPRIELHVLSFKVKFSFSSGKTALTCKFCRLGDSLLGNEVCVLPHHEAF